MREYQVRDNAELWPMCCTLTETQTGPFVDTFVDHEVMGRKYVSFRAIEMLAPLAGFVPQAQLEEALGELARCREYAHELEARLEEESRPEAKVVKLSEILEYVNPTPTAA